MTSTLQVPGATFLSMAEVRVSTEISPTMSVKIRMDLHVSEVDDHAFMDNMLGAVNALSLPGFKNNLRTPNDCLGFFAKQLETAIQRMTLLPVARTITLEVFPKENLSLIRKIQIRSDGLSPSMVGGMTSPEELAQAWRRHRDAYLDAV